ncbi:MAG: S8 family serine peptidase [Thermodesulfobacteriota bacterium]
MRKGLVTLVILCCTPYISDLIPETSALEDIDGRDLTNRSAASTIDSKVSPKLTEVIGRIAETGAARNGIESLSAKDFSTPLVRVDDQGNIQVYVQMSEPGDENIGQLKELGMVTEVVNENLNIVQGWLPYGSIEQAAGLGFVSKITPPSYGYPREGSVTTEGDAIMGSDEARETFGVDGSGIKVGVISDGIDSVAASRMTGDLPNIIQVGDAGTGDEGTAILEIVHDIAPGANLAFHNGTTTLNFIEAIEFFTDIGADVIVDDIGFLSEPFFQDGSVAQAAAQAVANGIIYVSAAGNDSDAHYQAVFVDTDPEDAETELHDYGLAAGEGSDVGMTIELPANRSSVVVLQWSNPFGEASDDYDLFLVDPDTAEIISSSTDTQDGDDDPIEIASISNEGPGTGFYDIVINKFSGEDQTLEIFFNLGGDPLEFNVPEDSVYGHPAAPGVIAVGATFNGEVDFFSSEGPSSIFFPPTVTVSSLPSDRAASLLEERDTPTVVAPNRVSTSVPGFFSFAGTSASAPHAAGVAALVLQALGFGADIESANSAESSIITARQVEEVTDIITGTADDLSPAGFDNISGFGSINACAAVAEALGEDGCNGVEPPPGDGDSNDSGGCAIYGSGGNEIAAVTAFTNILILMIPVFVTAIGFLRRRKQ